MKSDQFRLKNEIDLFSKVKNETRSISGAKKRNRSSFGLKNEIGSISALIGGKQMNTTYKITLTAIFAAVYIVLSFITIRLGNVSITLAPLPILILTLAIAPWAGILVCFVGEFVLQTCLYGLTLTTPIWMIGPLLRPCVLSILILIFPSIKEKSWKFIIATVVAGLFTTAGNTLALYLDALIIGYPFSFVLVETAIRIAVGIATSTILGYLAFVCSKTISKAIKRT